MPVEVTCINCGKTLTLPPSRAKQFKYCSTKCMGEYQVGEANPHWKGGLISRTCEICGKDFQVKAKTVRHGGGKYCSRKCTVEATRGEKPALQKRVAKYCAVCGKEKRVRLSHRDTEGKYCSRECMAVGYTERLVGAANPNYKDGRWYDPACHLAYTREWLKKHPEVRRAINRRTKARRKKAIGDHSISDIHYLMRVQRGECVYCRIDIRNSYHVDHIIPLVRGGTNYIGNIQLLCPTCNLRKGKLLPIQFRKKVGGL